jgi:hypothetical protein
LRLAATALEQANAQLAKMKADHAAALAGERESAKAMLAKLTAMFAKSQAEQAAQLENAKAEAVKLAAELARLKKAQAAQQEKAKADKLPAANLDFLLTLGRILKRLDSMEQRLGALEQKANNTAGTAPAVWSWGPNAFSR